MRRIYGYGLGAFALAAASAAAAQTYQTWVGQAGEQLPGFVITCPTGSARQAAPCGTPGNPLQVASAPSASPDNGLAVSRIMTTASAAAMTIKPAPGRLYAFNLCNNASTSRYVRFYNAAAATTGTTPVYAGPITLAAGGCQQFTTAVGLGFSAGIALSVTAANGDGDATPGIAGDVSGFLGFL
ncbi:hypothetical protein DA075_10140 [Methylobacterium currus]|uniref:Uncharacterized protein n=1 Tax=Methylobacterium currus TaxID=2051553 RepID=A0A2R4WI68_9HYPH|nr:hypothetical protein [Methylobacterium currus]AWB21229.1 hypothetical protein DA075_10140 [Methylobacterium currus]